MTIPDQPPTITDLTHGLATQRLDPVELAETAFTQLARQDQAIMTGGLQERAHAEALAARQRLAAGAALGPLDGIPTGWKDLFDIAGRVTTAGSVILRGQPPAQHDAAIVAAARQAGAVSIATLNMTEFAYSGIGINPHYGTPLNPHAPGPGGMASARVPGGSSSGSAVAVARGILAFAIGTDTGGSIRVPAAFNGIVGFKASTGRYPMAGVFPLSRSLDSLGPLAHSAADCALVDAVLRGKPAAAPALPLLDTLRVLVPGNRVFDGCQDAVRANFEAACERLARAGVVIERMELPAFDAAIDVMSRHGSLVAAEAYDLHRERAEGPDASQIDPRVRQRILAARTITAADVAALTAARKTLIAQSTARIGAMLVAFPTVPHVAPELAPLLADDEAFTAVNARTLRNTSLGNFLDWCGVSLPSGTDRQALPTGFLLSATHGRDDQLLAAAMVLEPLVRGS